MRGLSSRGPSDRVRALSVNSNTEDVMLNSSFREFTQNVYDPSVDNTSSI